MGRAKEIIVRVIPSKIANDFVKKWHYSGKVAPTSRLHFGCFLDGKLHGVMSFGSSITKKPLIALVSKKNGDKTDWNGFLELNRMAFDEYLPKYSESRCFSIAVKLIKKNAPHIKWILSYADGSQCGDGTIYRASGFSLTGIVKNTSNLTMPNGIVTSYFQFVEKGAKGYKAMMANGYTNPKKFLNECYPGWEFIAGFQLRYIYLIDKTCKITVPILPFSKIDEMGAGMYKGEKRVAFPLQTVNK